MWTEQSGPRALTAKKKDQSLECEIRKHVSTVQKSSDYKKYTH